MARQTNLSLICTCPLASSFTDYIFSRKSQKLYRMYDFWDFLNGIIRAYGEIAILRLLFKVNQFKSVFNLRVDLDGSASFRINIHPASFGYGKQGLVLTPPELVFPQGAGAPHIRDPGKRFDFVARECRREILYLMGSDHP
jgi:hypothetical protein